MAGHKTFEVDLVVLDDSIYGDNGYDLVVTKFSTARTDVEEDVVVDCEDDKFQLTTFESVFNVNSYILI
ncbi:hypothetical protein Hanom_Chr10g00946481 [Helianthus anomalus]